MISPPLPHQSLFAHADHWFHRARAALLGVVPCRRGCDRCCIGTFAITLLDVDAVQAGLATLPEQVRVNIQKKANEQVEAMEKAYPRLKHSRDVSKWKDDLDQLAERFADLPCPALAQDGSCQVYAFRPFTCRTMGIPVEQEGIVHGACEVQTAVPLIKLSQILKSQEDDLAAREAHTLQARRNRTGTSLTPTEGEEVLLPYGFLSAEHGERSGPA